jgi:hypothetical protein
MGKINVEWHLSHKMPKNPKLEQRIEWHKEHAKNCSCRPNVEEFIKKLENERKILS